ncbi:hypothetical protein [Kitasatospora sp. NPDC057738]|uniref:hypothetical protein n=1 Tax=Kitasatospora sp. NPDC057738 TaxID=3346233 RepID=UPI0036C6706B
MPDIPMDILDRLRAVEDQVRQIAGRAQMRPALNQILAGDVTVGQGGTFKVNTKTGTAQFYVGVVLPTNPDGSEQRGLLANRQDGTLALMIGNRTGSSADPQGILINDARGNALLAEDVIGGGLASPQFGADGWFGATESPQYGTASGTFTTCMRLPWKRHHPAVEAHYLVKADPGVAGEIRLVDGAGAVVATASVSSGSFTYNVVYGPVSGGYLSTQYLQWQARVTSGTGNIAVRGLSTFGINS